MVLAVAVAMSIIPFDGSVVAASESPFDGEATDAALVRASNHAASVDAAGSQHFWVWSKGSRGYYLKGGDTLVGFADIVAVNLETGAELGREKLERAGYGAPYANQVNAAVGTHRTMAVDEEGGRLFLATQFSVPQLPIPVTADPAWTRGWLERAARAAGGSSCVSSSGTSLTPCIDGVSVLDAETMQPIRHVPLRGLQADAAMVAPQLLEMTYTPGTSGSGKIHMVLQDHGMTAKPVEGQLPVASPRMHSVNAHYLVQVDPDTGQQDWALRLDACRGALVQPRVGPNSNLLAMPHQAAILSVPDRDAVYVACHSVAQTFTAAVVRVPLTEDGNLAVGLPEAPDTDAFPQLDGDSGSVDAPRFDTPRAIEVVQGPDKAYEMLADPVSNRLLVQVQDGSPWAQVWWVFDAEAMQFMGTIGIGGPVALGSSLATVAGGRLYVLASRLTVTGKSFSGGLFVADVGRTPVAQALVFPEFADHFPRTYDDTKNDRWALSSQALPDGGQRLWFPDRFVRTDRTRMQALDDVRGPAVVSPEDDYVGRTLDLAEADGVTQTTMDGAARGYGVRALLVGGPEAAARVGPADPGGAVDQCNDANWADTDAVGLSLREQYFPGRATGGPCHWTGTRASTPCAHGDREIIFASVGPDGPAVVDDAGARGAAEPISIDSLTAADLESPVSRCGGQDWDQLWQTALFGRAPAGEPRGPDQLRSLMAECVSSSDNPTAKVGDPVADGYSAHVTCEREEATGHAYARGGSVGGVTVAESLSSFRIYKDPARGVVSRVESVARGVAIDALVRLDTVRGIAESWANGRNQPVAIGDREAGYDPNCDYDRSAGTCFRRHLFGVWTPEWSCGPCGDEAAFVYGLNSVLSPNALVRLREPDVRLAVGAENGYLAAVQKPDADRFGDLVLNNDLLQTVLPTLEVIRYAAPNRYLSRMGARGRQIYQFAGVEVSSSYGIQCLLVYDDEAGTCAAPVEVPGAITVSLSAPDGERLAGGAFELREDVDADGVLGLKDALVPDGVCVTAEDGIGTCVFENLQPGTYLVSQVAAPTGYVKSAEPWVSELAPGEQRSVAFTNTSNVSTIAMTVTDEAGGRLSGAAFAAYPDPDADGKVAPEAEPAAICTTDAEGVCSMQVPAGSYVLVQTGAPGGLEGIEPLAFTLASGGQVAAVTVVNYPPGQPAAPQSSASPVVGYSPPVGSTPPRESVKDYLPVPVVNGGVTPSGSLPDQIGGTVVQVIRAPGDALRLLARNPKEAVAWTAALALLALAALAVRRRQHVRALLAET